MSIDVTGKTKKVFVGVSGGVDSSVAAALLKERGHEVTGVFIKIWHPEISACDWRAEMRDAMRVCAHLDIPFEMIDLSDVYLERVIGYLIDAYKKGLTPNPDVMCNGFVKFGAFYDWAIKQGADAVATGHYAQIKNRNEAYELHAGVDETKDQSYFLWQIKKDQLAHILFPVGAYTKKEIRALAEKFTLPTATKPDSQGLCFIGDVDVKAFLKKHIDVQPGNVLNESGEVIGMHDGAALYTIGERHGFTITNTTDRQVPHYIIAKDIAKNSITVSAHPKDVAQITEIVVDDVNLLAVLPNTANVVVRYHGEKIPVTIQNNEGQLLLRTVEPMKPIALGQSAVLFDETRCVAGGIISDMK